MGLLSTAKLPVFECKGAMFEDMCLKLQHVNPYDISVSGCLVFPKETNVMENARRHS